MSKDNKVLKEFQSDYYRGLEEDFARTLAEDEKVRLFFINEDQAFTDGINVVVDPATHDLYKDEQALADITRILGWDESILANTWQALRITTRAQTIHECLHLLYTDFPPHSKNDTLCDTQNKKIVMNLISNIIEDCYIEAVGCSIYDNLSFFLKYGRVSKLFAHKQVKGTAERVLDVAKPKEIHNTPIEPTEKQEVSVAEKEIQQQLANLAILREFVDYMAGVILYPFLERELPADIIKTYVEETEEFFHKGCVAASPAERYSYCQKIFKVISHLIPPDSLPMTQQEFKYLKGGEKTHQGGNSFGEEGRKGRTQQVTKGLFDKNGDESDSDNVDKILSDFAKEKEAGDKNSEDQKSGKFEFSADQLGAPPVHNNIKVTENHPAIRPSLKVAYQNIYRKYKMNINSYNSRFAQLLQAHVSHREEKYSFGSGITSTRLGDIKKRYWYRNVEGIDVPDMAVLVLVDGSGSMYGARKEAATNATLILHEVLKTQHIPHAIVEHRSHGEDPEMEANVLVGFNPRPNEKLNILQIDADGDNRDGLALYWGARYLNNNTSNDYKLMIVISDGQPSHCYDEYYGAVGVQDTANAVKKLTKQGIHVVAIALDEEGSYECYNDLSVIYPHLIHCDNLKHLTSSLLGVIAKML